MRTDRLKLIAAVAALVLPSVMNAQKNYAVVDLSVAFFREKAGYEEELGTQNLSPRKRQGIEKLRSVIALLLGDSSNPQKSGEKSPAKSQDVSTLNGIKAYKGAKIQSVHTKGLGEGAH